jgi:arsenite-transporting ATPase
VIDQYAPVPVRTVPQFDREMIGLDRLAEIGRALFGEDDPTAFFYRGRPYQVRAAEGEHILEVALPFTTREDVKIARDGDELQLQVGGLRRTIVLPRALVDAPTMGAKMEDGVLQIRFRTQGDAKATRRSR